MSRSARDVLNELKWRKRRDLERAEIWILDRTRQEGGRILSGAEVVDVGRRYLSTATATIPLYKVVKIVVNGETVFERKTTARES